VAKKRKTFTQEEQQSILRSIPVHKPDTEILQTITTEAEKVITRRQEIRVFEESHDKEAIRTAKDAMKIIATLNQS